MEQRRRDRNRETQASLISNDRKGPRPSKHLREEEKRLKKLAKEVETPEEKRARRLAKKEAKERKRKGEMGWDEEDLGYTNTNNPFGDHKLRESFTWHKKNEKLGVTHTGVGKSKQDINQDNMKVELQKVKQRRMERENQRAAREEEMALMQRQKEAALFEEWEKQEDDFHLEQARKRSKIRIKDGRAKPIDLLAEYVNPEEDDFEVQVNEPCSVLVGLSIDDIEDLLEDIKVYMKLEQGQNAEFWKDITTVAADELEKLRVIKGSRDTLNHREVINTAVRSDVVSVFQGKTYSQLLALEKQIRQKIKAGGTVDIGYWESLLQHSKAFIAKTRLKERHRQKLRKQLLELKQEKTNESDKEADSRILENNSPQVESQPGRSSSPEKALSEEEKDEEETRITDFEKVQAAIPLSEEELAVGAYQEYERGGYSPRLLSFQDIEEGNWIDPDDDLHKLGYLRIQVKSGSTVEEEELEDKKYAAVSNQLLGEDEEAFNVPVKLNALTYSWTDKYRPRKPRFFNRVHTGYEWNKYNQTHYDSDNPPPKIVQGYKFNIFYPELIDKTQTPEYHLTPCKDNDEFGILKFAGGPPYEDIAFKVVNREWELAHKHGFRCQFQNNVFQLWFHFKRYRYRR